MSTTLGEDLPRVMAYVRDELIPMYQSIGPSGGFAIACMRASLDKAAVAMVEGDTIAMLAAYQDLRSYKE